MEEPINTPVRSITPIDSSYNTDTDKEFLTTLDRNFKEAAGHRRVLSNDLRCLNLQSNSTLSKFCSGCFRYEREIQELKRDMQRESEKFATREAHIRQLDTLLQLKEKRLKDEESAIHAENKLLLAKIDDLKKLLHEVNVEKAELETDNKLLAKENSNFLVKIKKFEVKLKDLRRAEDDSEEAYRNSIFKSLESRENHLKRRENEISQQYKKLEYETEVFEENNLKLAYYEENLIAQEQDIKIKYEELARFEAELEATKIILDENKAALEEEAINQLSFFKTRELQLEIQEKALKSKFTMLDREFDSIESLKKQLQKQKRQLDKELNTSQRDLSFSRRPSVISEVDSEINAALDDKERYIEEMIEKLNDEEQKLEGRWKEFKSTEDLLKNEIEFYRKKCQMLEDKLKKSDKISCDCEDKLSILKNKENELYEFAAKLAQERQEVDNTAELVKSLNNELIEQQTAQQRELEAINKEKIKLAQMLDRQESRANLIALKEKELLLIEEKLNIRKFSSQHSESPSSVISSGEIIDNF